MGTLIQGSFNKFPDFFRMGHFDTYCLIDTRIINYFKENKFTDFLEGAFLLIQISLNMFLDFFCMGTFIDTRIIKCFQTFFVCAH